MAIDAPLRGCNERMTVLPPQRIRVCTPRAQQPAAVRIAGAAPAWREQERKMRKCGP
jgi:hypothetical protein